MKDRRFFVRSVDLARHLDVFLVAAVASVIGNRIFLVATGYPQVGNGTLHISHAIWGALMMATAVVIALTYVTPVMRGVVALLGGIGFGFFVDELGKFITRDVNYFFRPTFALIYIIFVLMFFAFRGLESKQFGPSEGIANALEALKDATVGRLDETRRAAAIDLLQTTGASGVLADRVRALLDEIPVLAAHEPGRAARAVTSGRAAYYRWTERRSFGITITGLFLFRAVASLAATALVVLDNGGIHGFGEWVGTLSVAGSTALIVIGVCLLPFSRPRAYRWLNWGLLFDLLVTQIYVFEQQQLVGTIGLAITLVYWVLLRSAISAEHDRSEAPA